ncbi:MAG TPA: tetratricopeptide repeat protein, partial [Isosphaeraceae bacterium]
RLDSSFALAYMHRGMAWAELKEFDRALADFNSAVNAEPGTAWTYASRADGWRFLKDWDRALADYDRAIELDSKNAVAYLHRGMTRRTLKDYAGAMADYEQSLKISPRLAVAHNNIAWLLATCPEASFRDGKRAVAVATHACELDGWKNPNHLDTLAAAYAEAGDFSKAAEWQARAIAMAVGQTSGEDWRARLDLYRRGMPYRGE